MAEASDKYSPAFLGAIDRVLKDEGDYVNNPLDAGGETKFGISKRTYPNLDIENLTRDQAVEIYFRDWWQKFRLDLLPPRIAAKVFDIGVDIYMVPAIICLQRALRACGAAVEEDGVLGSMTIVAATSLCNPMPAGPPVNPDMLMAALRSELAAHYRLVAQNNRRDQVFIKGWLNRAYA